MDSGESCQTKWLKNVKISTLYLHVNNITRVTKQICNKNKVQNITEHEIFSLFTTLSETKIDYFHCGTTFIFFIICRLIRQNNTSCHKCRERMRHQKNWATIKICLSATLKRMCIESLTVCILEY